MTVLFYDEATVDRQDLAVLADPGEYEWTCIPVYNRNPSEAVLVVSGSEIAVGDLPPALREKLPAEAKRAVLVVTE